MLSFLSNISETERKIVIAVGIVAVLAGGYYAVIGDKQEGSWRYGVCKTFLERHVRFPETLDVMAPFEREASAKIYYTQTNPYGQQQMQLIECHYKPSATGSPELNKVTIDRTPISKDKIDSFNKTIPVVLTTDMDLEYPPKMQNSLEKLKR